MSTRNPAKVYLDEDVDELIADMLRSHGYLVLTTTGEGRKGENDQNQLQYSSERGMVILTHNRDDFVDLSNQYFELGKEHFGIVWAVRRPPKAIVERLLTLLKNLSADDFRNQFLII